MKQIIDHKLDALAANLQSLRQKSEDLNKRRTDLIKRQNDMTLIHGDFNVKPSDMIHFNVGGTEMHVLRSTLTLVKGSRLEVLFCGRWENKLLKDEKGRVFFDLDPIYFKMVIQYLYWIKRNKSSNDDKKFDTGFLNSNKKRTFELYLDFFRLRKGQEAETQNAEISEAASISGISHDDVEQQERDTHSLNDALKSELDELKILEASLDVMEKKLEDEESFVSYFIAANETETKQQDESCSEQSLNKEIHDVESTFESIKLKDNSKDSNELTKETNRKNDILNLWVEGEIFTIKRSTLCMCEGSSLANNFSGDDWINQHMFRTNNGVDCVLIEEDSNAFLCIINHLRLRAMGIEENHIHETLSFCYSGHNVSLLQDVVSVFFEGNEEFIISSMKNSQSAASDANSNTSERAPAPYSFSFGEAPKTTSADGEKTTTATQFSFGSNKTTTSNNDVFNFGSKVKVETQFGVQKENDSKKGSNTSKGPFSFGTAFSPDSIDKSKVKPSSMGAKDIYQFESNIITSLSHHTQLLLWLSERNGEVRRKELSLLYRASRDGWTSEAYKDKCYDKIIEKYVKSIPIEPRKRQILIVKTSGGHIFGGYWGYKTTNEGLKPGQGGHFGRYKDSFLFSLSSSSKAVYKMELRKGLEQYAVYLNNSYGPTFGYGNNSVPHDLCIGQHRNGFLTSGYSNLGHTYEIPSGKDKNFLTGGSDFIIEEMEVFQYGE